MTIRSQKWSALYLHSARTTIKSSKAGVFHQRQSPSRKCHHAEILVHHILKHVHRAFVHLTCIGDWVCYTIPRSAKLTTAVPATMK